MKKNEMYGIRDVDGRWFICKGKQLILDCGIHKKTAIEQLDMIQERVKAKYIGVKNGS